MKIAVFIKSTTFNSSYGGLETQNKVLCEGLVKRGHDITVFSPAQAQDFTDQAKEENGVKYVFIPCTYRMLFASMDKNNWYTKSYKEFLKYHKENPFNAVISQSSAGLGVIKRRQKIGLKVVGISHGTIGGEMKTLVNTIKSPADLVKSTRSLAFGIVNFFGRQREYIHGCSSIIAVSSAVKEAIINETYISDNKITVIHNGMDGSNIPKKNWNESNSKEPFKILYVGRIEESKGLAELLQACTGIQNCFINIVGNGPYLESLKALSRKYKLSQRILFYGKLPYEKVVELYALNDVFVLPTKRVEGFPMTLVEACFSGLPIIATDMGGNRDAVTNEHNGFLLTHLDVSVLKDSLTKLADAPNLAKEMGINGRIKANREFTLDKMLDSYEKVMDDL